MHGAGQGLAACILCAFLTGVAVWVVGQILFDTVRSPVVRLAVGSLYALPAGFAGYHAVYGVGGLILDQGVVLAMLSGIGAVLIGATAWPRIASFGGSVSAVRSVPVEGVARGGRPHIAR